MAKSTHVAVQDMCALFQLVGECRELGDDAAGWWEHLLAGLAKLTGADLAIGGEMADCYSGQMRDLGNVQWGWQGGFDQKRFARGLEEFARNPNLHPIMDRFMLQRRHSDLLSLRRSDLLDDRVWYKSSTYQLLCREVGVDNQIWCFQLLPGSQADESSGVILQRAVAEPDFSLRDRALVEAAHRAFNSLIGGPLARFAEPSPATLAPRVRQVLQCLLEGDGDKQIAARLGLTRNTVNQYVKVIYGHFGVVSRPELLARWIRRGWGNKSAWRCPELRPSGRGNGEKANGTA